jgi:hypothetical protein
MAWDNKFRVQRSHTTDRRQTFLPACAKGTTPCQYGERGYYSVPTATARDDSAYYCAPPPHLGVRYSFLVFVFQSEFCICVTIVLCWLYFFICLNCSDRMRKLVVVVMTTTLATPCACAAAEVSRRRFPHSVLFPVPTLCTFSKTTKRCDAYWKKSVPRANLTHSSGMIALYACAQGNFFSS